MKEYNLQFSSISKNVLTVIVRPVGHEAEELILKDTLDNEFLASLSSMSAEEAKTALRERCVKDLHLTIQTKWDTVELSLDDSVFQQDDVVISKEPTQEVVNPNSIELTTVYYG